MFDIQISDSDKLFFTSDTHFGHANIIKYCNRPFKNSYEMDETMIKNWNEVIKPKDYIFHLGDFSFHKRERSESIIWRLNGKIFFLYGNHDKLKNIPQEQKDKFIHLGHYYELKVHEKNENKHQLIVLCHYAFKVWNKSHWGSIHLFGHSHGNLPVDKNSKSLDVGVDVYNFTPVSYMQIKEILSKRNFKPNDHHGEKDE